MNKIYITLCLVLLSCFGTLSAQPEPKKEYTVENFEKLIDEIITVVDQGTTLKEINASLELILKRDGFKTFPELQSTWLDKIGEEKIQKVLNEKEWSKHIEKVTKLINELQELYNKATQLKKDGKYDQAAEAFLKTAEAIPGSFRVTCYFNAVCSYSLAKNNRKACVYFAKAVKEGFRDLEQIKASSDLDNIRKEEMYLYVTGLLETLTKAVEEMLGDPNSEEYKKAKETAKETAKLLDTLDIDALEKKYFTK